MDSGVAFDDPNFNVSEQKRKEALEQIEAARECQQVGDDAGADRAIRDSWKSLEHALDLCPSNHRARFLLVSCAMNSDDYHRAKEEALRIYDDLTDAGDTLRQMNDSVLHLAIAHASKMLGHTDDAIRFAQEATELFRDDPQSYMILGEIYEARGQDEEAEHWCRQALLYNDNPNCHHQLNPQNVYFTLCCLSASLIKQGKYSEAELFLLRAARLDTSQTLALRHLVDAYHFQGRPSEAMQVARRIAEMDPEDVEIQQKIEVLRSQPSLPQSEYSDYDQDTLRSSVHSRPSLRHHTHGRRDNFPPASGRHSSMVSGASGYRDGTYRSRGRDDRGSVHSVTVSARGRDIDVPHRRDSGRKGDKDPKKESKSSDGGIFGFCCIDR